jgi:NADPH:quinone reductase-like Zn-dependent oxidoreductase
MPLTWQTRFAASWGRFLVAHSTYLRIDVRACTGNSTGRLSSRDSHVEAVEVRSCAGTARRRPGSRWGRASTAISKAIAELVEAGKLRPAIAGTFPLADAAEVHALGDTGRTTGRLVLTVH